MTPQSLVVRPQRCMPGERRSAKHRTKDGDRSPGERPRGDASLAHADLRAFDATKPCQRRCCGVARVHPRVQIPAGSFFEMEGDFVVERTLERRPPRANLSLSRRQLPGVHGVAIQYGAEDRIQAVPRTLALASTTSHQKRLPTGTIERWAAIRMGIAGMRNRGHS